MDSELSGVMIQVAGIVQGVGFRPFVYILATRMRLNGWVRNTSAGVDIQLDGPPSDLEAFISNLKSELPPLARIDQIEIAAIPPGGFTTFEIIHSQAQPEAFQPVAPDMCVCDDCLQELFDPADRRYQYPFINCTNCGPRFTIIRDIPYDRPLTSMASFPMCADCAAEYTNPLDRRFHAQPVACPKCGPRVWLENPGELMHDPSEVQVSVKNQSEANQQVIERARGLLAEGKILAVKGLGGFHLACDASNPAAVAELRARKLRVDKPFAIMMLDIQTVREHCQLSQAEQALLESRQRPIVILKRRPDARVAPAVAPNHDTIGVMLPYTPLHYLLLAAPSIKPGETTTVTSWQPGSLAALVMTSGNHSEEPIAFENDQARQRFSGLADAFLMHDRPIHIRCDDSVARVLKVSGQPYLLRRARGYAPNPLHLPWDLPEMLATGAELKNTFCLTRGPYAFISHHIGDMENYETLQSFESGIDHYERLFRIKPRAIACDLHPNYLSTRYAQERAERQGIPAIGVQHHHAHIAACMAEHGLAPDQTVIGVAFDGTGYGSDGEIWGGEFLLANYASFRRVAHLAYAPLPGGDNAIRKPARIALAYLWQAGLEWDINLPCVAAVCAEERHALRLQLEHGINTPMTSSMGRLFDAIAALTGVRQSVNYEAQAAIELEALADPLENSSYLYDLIDNGALLLIQPERLIEAVISDIFNNVARTRIAARFHNTIIRIVVEICQALSNRYSTDQVVLSGGVWQNMTLLEKSITDLHAQGLKVFVHRQVPANDGGLCLGQAVIAAHSLNLWP